MTLFLSNTNFPIGPPGAQFVIVHCMRPWLHHGVLVNAIPWLPPLLPIFPSVALTKARGEGTSALVRLILDMAEATRCDCTSCTRTPWGSSSAAKAVLH